MHRFRIGLVIDRMSIVLTAGHADFGVTAMRFAAKWVRHLCQDVPGRFAAIASTRSAWASEVTSRVPVKPRATRSAKNALQACLVSQVATGVNAEDLAVTVGVDPGRHEHDGVDDPALFADLHGQRVGGDERELSELAQRPRWEGVDLRSAAIRETCDFDRLVMPSVCTSLSSAGSRHRAVAGATTLTSAASARLRRSSTAIRESMSLTAVSARPRRSCRYTGVEFAVAEAEAPMFVKW
ncbi:hypothetical protein Aph02nite_68450 [Actinoplanes philippinensis]|nr:hypothetical protein Aph02nite_68450 [Actinoplanes philippinensis]